MVTRHAYLRGLLTPILMVQGLETRRDQGSEIMHREIVHEASTTLLQDLA